MFLNSTIKSFSVTYSLLRMNSVNFSYWSGMSTSLFPLFKKDLLSRFRNFTDFDTSYLKPSKTKFCIEYSFIGYGQFLILFSKISRVSSYQ